MFAGIMIAFLLSYPNAGVSQTIMSSLNPPAIEVKQKVIVEQTDDIIEEKEEKMPKIDSLDLLARVIECEAGNQGTMGKRLVCDVILNRYDSKRFPNTISGVVYQRNQFECLIRSWFWTRKVPEENYEIIDKELYERTQDEVLFF